MNSYNEYNSYSFESALTTDQQMDLYAQYKKGDEEAKERIAISYVKCISKMINNADYGRLKDKEDMLSELVLIVYDAIDKYDPSKAKIYTYLYRVIYTRLIDRLRVQATRCKHLSDIDAETLLKLNE